MGGLMNDFRSEDCHKFLHWLQGEIKRLDKDLPKGGDDIGIVEVASEVISVAIFAFSKLAYKILCDNHGRIVPTNLLSEIKGLEAFKENTKASKPRRFKGNVWDAYQNKDAWIQDLIQSAQEICGDVIQTLAQSDDLENEEIEFAPKAELIIEPLNTVKPTTSHEVIYLDLESFLELYNQPSISFNEPEFAESWQEYGWFEHYDWNVVLMAKIIIQATESYRLFMKRLCRRNQDLEGFEKYAVQNGEGFIEMYKYLREKYVEPRFDLGAKVDEEE
ncbi:hypothetical protein DZF79_04970 [Vibrio parahaemolyticus]|nr:hypothetical protein [Vibrio parahaemolyticus]